MTHASRALQSHDLLGEGISCGSHTSATFLTTQGHGRPAQCQSHLRDNTNIKDDTHTVIHSHIHSNKADMRRRIMMAK